MLFQIIFLNFNYYFLKKAVNSNSSEALIKELSASFLKKVQAEIAKQTEWSTEDFSEMFTKEKQNSLQMVRFEMLKLRFYIVFRKDFLPFFLFAISVCC